MSVAIPLHLQLKVAFTTQAPHFEVWLFYFNAMKLKFRKKTEVNGWLTNCESLAGLWRV